MRCFLDMSAKAGIPSCELGFCHEWIGFKVRVASVPPLCACALMRKMEDSPWWLRNAWDDLLAVVKPTPQRFRLLRMACQQHYPLPRV